VKNLNLRVRKDGSVYVSASSRVPISEINKFVLDNISNILEAQEKFKELSQFAPSEKSYVDGEIFYILGNKLTLSVIEDNNERVERDDETLTIYVKNTDDFERKQRIYKKYIDELCNTVFGELLEECYKRFSAADGPKPQLRVRDMTSRWGSCFTKRGIITMNRRLIATPIECIEYVAVHEYCHFFHPDHSRYFYMLVECVLPDWKKRVEILNSSHL
jgi:hypothetical protein